MVPCAPASEQFSFFKLFDYFAVKDGWDGVRKTLLVKKSLHSPSTSWSVIGSQMPLGGLIWGREIWQRLRKYFLLSLQWSSQSSLSTNTQPLGWKLTKTQIMSNKNHLRKPLLTRKVWASRIEKDSPTGRMWPLAELECPTSHNDACIPVSNGD